MDLELLYRLGLLKLLLLYLRKLMDWDLPPNVLGW